MKHSFGVALIVALSLAAASRRAHAQSRVTHSHRALAAASQRPPAAPRAPCLAPVVEIRRAHDERVVWRGALSDCAGRPALRALAALSVLASPAHLDAMPTLEPVVREIRRVAPAVGWSLTDEQPAPRHARPAPCPPGREPVAPPDARATRRRAPQCRAIVVAHDRHTHDPLVELEHRVRVINPRLVAMLAQVTAHFPGHRVELISGYRPSRDPDAGSRHAHARALDFRVAGVSREALRDFTRTLASAGVGYYPNSVFVHMDVRDPDEGPARWTDYAGPGEHARYGHWPPSDADVRREVAFEMDEAQRALAEAGRGEPATDEPDEPARDGNDDASPNARAGVAEADQPAENTH